MKSLDPFRGNGVVVCLEVEEGVCEVDHGAEVVLDKEGCTHPVAVIHTAARHRVSAGRRHAAVNSSGPCADADNGSVSHETNPHGTVEVHSEQDI